MTGSLVGDGSSLRYVNLHERWANELQELEYACFPTVTRDELYSAPELAMLAREFPAGNFVVLDGDKPIAMGLGVRVDFDFGSPQHSVKDLVTSNSTGDDPGGRWYYGTDISVDPAYRRRGIGQNLYGLRKKVCRDLNLRGIVAGGVIPGYADHKTTMTAAQYVEAVTAGELYDATLSFQLENGFETRGVLENYLEDPAVDSWASLIVWSNTEFA
ncbi:MAG: GNAT family N-acetyltransferase [Actinobacteria bacterium]|nr:GNAT family N-acetyltransferase [Actinomycetota bacterium]